MEDFVFCFFLMPQIFEKLEGHIALALVWVGG